MPRRNPVELAEKADDLTEAELLDLLRELAPLIEATKVEAEAQWRARRIIYHALRRIEEWGEDDDGVSMVVGPKVTLAQIAEAAGVVEVSVITALKKPDPLHP